VPGDGVSPGENGDGAVERLARALVLHRGQRRHLLGSGQDLPRGGGLALGQQLDGGIALTQTGNLGRKFVQENADRFGWDFSRPPRTEDELYDLYQLRHFAQDLGLARRSGRKLTLTATHCRAIWPSSPLPLARPIWITLPLSSPNPSDLSAKQTTQLAASARSTRARLVWMCGPGLLAGPSGR
jgi:hypothetical protein